MNYWELESFACPIKQSVVDMTKDWYIHSLAWGAWYLDNHITLAFAPIGFESLSPLMVFLATTVSVILGVLRSITAGITLYKAWRDRRNPEKH